MLIDFSVNSNNDSQDHNYDLDTACSSGFQIIVNSIKVLRPNIEKYAFPCTFSTSFPAFFAPFMNASARMSELLFLLALVLMIKDFFAMIYAS